MSNIGYMIASKVVGAVDGTCTVYDSGTVLVDIPRTSLLRITHTFDECGIVCHCEHTIKKRNGHLLNVPNSKGSCLPEWTGELDGAEPNLKRVSVGEADCLIWDIDCLVPLVFSRKENLIEFGHLQYHLEAQVHIIEANQPYTLEWLHYIRAGYAAE